MRKSDQITAALMTLLLTTALSVGLSGCRTEVPAKVFYLNSYHVGYGSSDDVMAGIVDMLSGDRVQLTTFFLDTKRHPELAADKATQALKAIEQVQPDILIASDDDAVKYVVAEHFKEGPIPCVFCGVNWTCDRYGLPTPSVTGMLEVLPVQETIEVLRQYYPNVRRLTVLSENTNSEQKNREALLPVFAALGLSTEYVVVHTYGEWKEQFLKANAQSDIIFLPTNGAIQGWDEADARAFVREQIRVPVFTCDDFMMAYAVFGLTKVAREQGEWAAQMALEILGGKSPAQIPVTRNRQTAAYLNGALARKIGFEPEPELWDRCRIVE
jgi:ABC-type uncharacterized transport system substrate-binding protein